MKFKNFSAYVQRQIDLLLKNMRSFARIFINDIIIFSRIRQKHSKHLKIVFNRLFAFGIILNFVKIFFEIFVSDIVETSSECTRSNNREKKTFCYIAVNVFQNIEKIENLFETDRLISHVYFLLCSNREVVAASKNPAPQRRISKGKFEKILFQKKARAQFHERRISSVQISTSTI